MSINPIINNDWTPEPQPSKDCLAKRWGNLFSMLCCLGFSEEEAKEAVQEAMLCGVSAIANRKAFCLSNHVGWLRSATVRIAFSIRKRNSRHRSIPDDFDPVDVTVDEPAVDELARAELQEAVRKAIRRLPERQRTILVFCRLEGHTLREAAKQFGIHFRTVKDHLDRAFRELREMLAAFADEAAKKMER